MGNQASRVIERKRDGNASRKIRRRSTATLQSHVSHGNYNWIEENQATALSAGALNAAMAAAQQQQQQPPQPPQQQPRRKSITEFFTKRKMSFTAVRPSEEDFREYDRLQRVHYLLKSARKTNAWAPIEAPAAILDIGCGNGIWALEMATQFHQSQVLGFDIRPPPEQTAGPKNLRYVQANIHERWPMADNAVDFIFMRNMAQDIQKQQWPALLQEMLRVLKPGGYIELLDIEPQFHNPGPVQQAFDGFQQGQWTEQGLDFQFCDLLEKLIEETGFAQVERRMLDIPIGEWPDEPELKQFGFINKETKKAFLRNRKKELVAKWGISSDDYDMAIQEILEEFDDYHSFSRFNCWIATKPSA